jgi:hypothetical protein
MKWLENRRNAFIDNWYNANGYGLFLVICMLYIALHLLKRMLIIDNIAAFEVMTERGEIWVFDLFFALQYAMVPFFLVWKITVTSFVLWVGCFLFGYNLGYKSVWKLILILEIVFIGGDATKLIWFLISNTDPNYADFTSFYPFSLQNIFWNETFDPRWLYPLKALNLFELLYWIMMGFGVYALSGKKIKTSMVIVASTYSLFFVLWLGYWLMVYR